VDGERGDCEDIAFDGFRSSPSTELRACPEFIEGANGINLQITLNIVHAEPVEACEIFLTVIKINHHAFLHQYLDHLLP
jgi:hypothetical protein